jgi:4-amino-4-deoxy-L-arabinose transferase-like glycosyltransferase
MNFFRRNFPVFIGLAAALLFVPFIGMVHLFDWDEINFAECAREMLVSGNYLNLQMNYHPFGEKPPLFIWLTVIAMKLFGVSEFSARLPNAICGIVTLIILYRIGTRLYDQRMGLLWVLCYAGSTLPQFYFKTGIIDPWFNLLIFLGIYFFIKYSFDPESPDRKRKMKWLIFSGLLTGLAILTKGPAAFIITGLCIGIFYLIRRFKDFIPGSHIIFFLFIIFFIGGLWFAILAAQGKWAVLENFISYQVHLFQVEDSGHGGPFYYHFVVLLFGCFPASVFALRAFKTNMTETPYQERFRLWMLILFWVVLILFSIVQTKIIHYSSLCYFPLTFLAAHTIYHIWNGSLVWKRWMSFLLFFTGGLFAIVLMLLSLVDNFKDRLINSGLINDEMAVENLKADVYWSGFEWLIGLLGLSAIIYSIMMAHKGRFRIALLVVLFGNLLTAHLASVIIVPKIEKYTQAPVIEFYKSLQGKDCYVESLNYLSYAQYFYTGKMPLSDPKAYSRDWLLHGPIDKDTYFVSKVTLHEMNMEQNPELVEIARKNGFIFYLRQKER